MVKPEHVIPLQEPIEYGKESIRELVMRRPKAKDFRSLPMEPSMGDMLNLAGDLAGQPPSVIDELDVADMMRVVEEVGKFMPSTPETGDKPSA